MISINKFSKLAIAATILVSSMSGGHAMEVAGSESDSDEMNQRMVVTGMAA